MTFYYRTPFEFCVAKVLGFIWYIQQLWKAWERTKFLRAWYRKYRHTTFSAATPVEALANSDNKNVCCDADNKLVISISMDRTRGAWRRTKYKLDIPREL